MAPPDQANYRHEPRDEAGLVFSNGKIPQSGEGVNDDRLHSTPQRESSLHLKTLQVTEDAQGVVKLGKKSDEGSRQSSSHEFVSAHSLSTFYQTGMSFAWPESKGGNDPTHLKLDQYPYHIPLNTRHRLGKTVNLIYAAETRKEHGMRGDFVALKCINIDSPKKKEEALREVEMLRKLRDKPHNHIIAFVATHEWGPILGIYMFPVAKYDLRSLMNRVSEYNESQEPSNRPSNDYHVRFLKTYFRCLCGALKYLHDNNIKHRDIKPANILVDRENSVVLTDFGISTQYPSRDQAMTRNKDTYSTITYAPEEAARPLLGMQKDLDIDVFSLGCVFLEIATVILGEQLSSLHTRLKPYQHEPAYFESLGEMPQWVETLRGRCIPSGDSLAFDGLDIIMSMMSEKSRRLRPTASELWDRFNALDLPRCNECIPEVQNNVGNVSSSKECEENLFGAITESPRMSSNRQSFPTSSAYGDPSTSTAAFSPPADVPKPHSAGLGINSVGYDSNLAPQSPAVTALQKPHVPQPQSNTSISNGMFQGGQVLYLDCNDCCRRKQKMLDDKFGKIIVWNSSDDTWEISDKDSLHSMSGVLFRLPQNHWGVPIPHLNTTVNIWSKLGWRNYHRLLNTPLEFLLIKVTQGIDEIYGTYPL